MQLTRNKSSNLHKLKEQLGVTLIELLVVIVLLGIVIALVGPFTVNQVDSAKARNEQLMLQRWLQKQSYHAFTTDSPISLEFDGKVVYRHLYAGTPLYIQEVTGGHLLDSADYGPGYGVEYQLDKNDEISQFSDLDTYLAYDELVDKSIDSHPQPDVVFHYIFFKPQSLLINRHGYINTTAFSYYYKGNEISLNIAELLNGTQHD